MVNRGEESELRVATAAVQLLTLSPKISTSKLPSSLKMPF
jgi:hypothetical protein